MLPEKVTTISRITRKVLIIEAERRKTILDWLSPLDFRDQRQELYEVRRERGTSEWVENTSSFIQWRDWKLSCNDPRQVLWCTGSPGVGKSISWWVMSGTFNAMSSF